MIVEKAKLQHHVREVAAFVGSDPFQAIRRWAQLLLYEITTADYYFDIFLQI